MRYVFLICSVLLFYSCKSQNIDELFLDFDEFPYTVDAEFYQNVHSNFDSLDPSYLRILYENVDHIDENSNDNIVRAFIEIDSLKDIGKWTEEKKSEYWEFYTIDLKALHKFQISPEIFCYTWFLEYSDMNQGPSKVFMTIYKNNEPSYCFELSSFAYYSDSPVWGDEEIEAQVFEDGLVKIHKIHAYGEYMDEGEDIEERWEEFKTISIKSGKVEVIDQKSTRENEN
ncbi:MAG: hypothetical protein JXL97_05150 [Bacteroidales bacterium]|nr:hypothetical protein [Bacteroidales bacterium]